MMEVSVLNCPISGRRPRAAPGLATSMPARAPSQARHGAFCPLSSEHFTGALIRPPGPLAGLDPGQRIADGGRVGRPHQPHDLVAVLQEHQRRPQLHAERTSEAVPAGVGDLDVADGGMIGERLGDERLRAAAMPAPRAAELQERRPREGIDLGSARLARRVVFGHRHAQKPLRKSPSAGKRPDATLAASYRFADAMSRLRLTRIAAMTAQSALPIDAFLPDLRRVLGTHNAAVLVAPPGAGKTTRVPLALAEEAWATDKKILVLEPRRLAARAAAERMARTLGVRFGSKVSRRTRIEIVTEGIFTRLILDDPALDGVAAVLFDEFHERSLDADLGLALALDAQQGLREDLKLLVMSATLDGARVAALLRDAPVIESEGRAFAVDTRYLGRDPRAGVEAQVADAVTRAVRADPGSVLVFLPGAGEIRRSETALRDRVSDPAIDVVPLYGALDSAAQDRAIAPAPAGRRKIVLATSIAETSLTIDGVRIVVDSGLARVPRYEPDVGLTRLETVRVSRASADQRRGRAGRTEPGICYRLWHEPQTASLEPYGKPEILAADLSSFALDVAQWGVSDS